MTPGIGALEGAKEGGAAGLGNSANPDAGAAGNAGFLQRNGPWSMRDRIGQKYELGPFRPDPYIDPRELGLPISERGKPGMGTEKAPVGAPPAAVDQAGIADQRMAGMWAAQRFHGMAPGRQTRSLGCDDCRNARLPLPAQPGVGWSIGGPGGPQTGPALVPRGLDPGLLGLPTGGGGEPLLGNPGFGDWIKDAWDALTDSTENALKRVGLMSDSEDGGSGGGGNGNTNQVGNPRPYSTVNQGGLEQAEMPWYEGLDDLADGVNWLYDHSLGWLSGKVVDAVNSTKWGAEALQWVGGAAVSAQNYIDEAGAQVFGSTQWNNLRSVMNLDNKYVQAVSNAIDFGTLIYGGIGAVKAAGGAGLKAGLGAVLKAEVRETAENSLERAGVMVVKEELGLSKFNPAGKILPSEAYGDVFVYLRYERGNPNPTYVGTTNNLARRAMEHGSKYTLVPLETPGLNRQHAKGIEQVIRERSLSLPKDY